MAMRSESVGSNSFKDEVLIGGKTTATFFCPRIPRISGRRACPAFQPSSPIIHGKKIDFLVEPRNDRKKGLEGISVIFT